MSKFTPGPWKWTYIQGGYHKLLGPNEEVIADDGSACSEYGPTIDVEGADAKLIAAAPELLEAVKGMLEWARRVNVLNSGPEVAAAVAAIAKAEGSGE